LLYGARIAAPWLIVPVQRLASHVHSWNGECDRRLVRLHDFIFSSPDLVLTGVLSDLDADALELHLWPDSDFNGDIMHAKSTGGMFLELAGLGGRGFPLSYGCRKTPAAPLHTPEAETVSLATYTRNEALPMQALLSLLLGRPVTLVAHEDNEAAIAIVRKGYSPSLRCLPRTQRCSLDVVHETYFGLVPDGCGKCELRFVGSADQKGDIMTKYLERPKLEAALSMIRVIDKSRV
jgi:hypothetical protein